MSRDIEFDVASSFAADVAEHQLIVKLDQGLHRHLVFQRREHSWNNRFELITVPGSLTITGDRGSYTFRRTTDMFQFFRSNPDRPHRINVSYWAEKLPDGGHSVKVHSEGVTNSWIQERMDEAVKERDTLQKEYDDEYQRELAEWREDLRAEGVEEGDPNFPAPQKDEEPKELIQARELVTKAREAITDHEHYGPGLQFAEGARELLDELEKIGLVSGTWEWDLTDWDFHFVWCLNAIAWGIQQYDNAIRSGLHVIRTGPVAWDTPLPTTPPAEPEQRRAAVKARPIEVVVTMGGRL